MYQHKHVSGETIALPLGKIVCIGRNYLDHIQELNNAVPDEALLFLKPATAAVAVDDGVSLPDSNLGACHNELEVAVLIERPLTKASPDACMASIWGYGLGLDLTLRDVQDSLKAKGQPWERAKAFDGSCPLTAFVPASQIAAPETLTFSLKVNGELRQNGNTNMMMRPLGELLAEISQVFTLLPGDVVLTGTPKGVGPLQNGDKLSMTLGNLIATESLVK